MNERCKDGCKVLGMSCVVCGWELKLMNLYLPKGKKMSPEFEAELKQFLPEGTRIVVVDDAEIPTINEVGFALGMHDKLYLTQQFTNGLRDE